MFKPINFGRDFSKPVCILTIASKLDILYGGPGDHMMCYVAINDT